MNQLNSVLLEGEFNHFTSKKGTLPLTFTLSNNREGTVKDFSIAVNSAKMADDIVNQLKKGKGLRVVGRLDRFSKSVVIIAEHIEVKPCLKN